MALSSRSRVGISTSPDITSALAETADLSAPFKRDSDNSSISDLNHTQLDTRSQAIRPVWPVLHWSLLVISACFVCSLFTSLIWLAIFYLFSRTGDQSKSSCSPWDCLRRCNIGCYSSGSVFDCAPDWRNQVVPCNRISANYSGPTRTRNAYRADNIGDVRDDDTSRKVCPTSVQSEEISAMSMFTLIAIIN
ncbi:unnamed protein product [Protopolystoma xenopodis]|uniref:Uncharacterized protein n=1 Tax=Protopolystoma xenopodis TaxID=117903 RepID=A0A3S5B3W1_9PLAT|nr:unnamed protein product [Protopolystoma xenopodis]